MKVDNVDLIGGVLSKLRLPEIVEGEPKPKNFIGIKNGKVARFTFDSISESIPTKPGPPGQVAFTSAGQHSFVVPSGVNKICAVCVGGGEASQDVSSYAVGAGGDGGDLRWRNEIDVTPGDTIAITVGAGGSEGRPGGRTFVSVGGTVVLSASGGGVQSVYSTERGNKVGGGNGGYGRLGSGNYAGGGGGAGGYSGDGGNAGNFGQRPQDGQGGGAGGGAGYVYDGVYFGSGGGGVGLLGEGPSGKAGVTGRANYGGGGGKGGSNGAKGTNTTPGRYGGGRGGRGRDRSGSSPGASGGARIIWGEGRAFPSTNTGDV